jgi:hypothetical protein
MAPIEQFKGRDKHDNYLQWIKENPNGYVLNCNINPNSNYLVIHRAHCYTINNLQKQANSWTEKYQKICSEDINELKKWARLNVNGYSDVTICSKCEP